MRILILAAGDDPQWHGDCPKQLVKIAGEPLLFHTLRSFEGHDVTVVTHKPEIKALVPDCFEPENRATLWETVLSTRPLWRGRVAVLTGDTFYTEERLEEIFDPGETPVLLDCYGFVFDEEDYDDMLEAIRKVGEFDREHMERLKHFIRKVPIKGVVDFDIVPYYEKFLEENPWAR